MVVKNHTWQHLSNMTADEHRWRQRKKMEGSLISKNIWRKHVKWEKKKTYKRPMRHSVCCLGGYSVTVSYNKVNNLGAVCVIPTRSLAGLIKTCPQETKVQADTMISNSLCQQLKTPTSINYIKHYKLNLAFTCPPILPLYHYVPPTCSLIGFRAELVHCLIGWRLVRYITLAWLSLDCSTLLEWHKLSDFCKCYRL